jgi:hypothetical protein
MFNSNAAKRSRRIEGAGMKLPAWIGIDPGASGAIAVVFGSGNVCWIKNDSTEHELANWIRELALSHELVAVIEQVNAMPKQGVSSTFKFGKSFKLILASNFVIEYIQIVYIQDLKR